MFYVRVETLVIIAINAAICIGTVFMRLWDTDTDITSILLLQSAAILSLIALHTQAWLRQGGGDLSLAFLFFLMVFIFNTGKALLFVFFYNKNETFFTFFGEHDLQMVVRALEYSYVGLFVISSAMLLTQFSGPPKQIQPDPTEITAAKVTGLVFLLFSLPAALIDLQSMLMQVLSGGYFAIYSAEQSYGAAGLVKVLAFFLFPAFYLCLVGFKDNRYFTTFIFSFALFYSLIKLGMGARLVALVPFLILISLWDSTIKPVNRKLIYVTAVLMIVVVFPALSLLRVGGELNQESGVTLMLFHIIKEMSDSISPLVWVMQRVPWEFDFLYGQSFVLAASTAIPNLFWDVHPAKAGSLALWLVNEVNPWIAERGGGYGFSIFAEMYLNFYWLGMLPLLVISVFITRLAQIKANPINTAFCFACFLGIMLWPRGELVAVARFILWNVGIPWLCYKTLVFAFARFR